MYSGAKGERIDVGDRAGRVNVQVETALQTDRVLGGEAAGIRIVIAERRRRSVDVARAYCHVAGQGHAGLFLTRYCKVSPTIPATGVRAV